MKKKIVIFLASITMIIVSVALFSQLSRTNQNGDNSSGVVFGDILGSGDLRLNQGNIYMALSSNDMSGYNRMFPIYFSYTLHDGNDYDADAIIEYFNRYFDTLNIYFKDSSMISTTSNLLWTIAEVSSSEFNLTLFATPEIDELELMEPMHVDRIRLNNNNDYAFSFQNFIIEAKETISEEVFAVTGSPVDVQIVESLDFTASYDIWPRTGETINNIRLVFPNGFASIINHEVIDTKIDEEGIHSYTIRVSFSDRKTGIWFRPFIEIEYGDNQIGWAISLMPAYITWL